MVYVFRLTYPVIPIVLSVYFPVLVTGTVVVRHRDRANFGARAGVNLKEPDRFAKTMSG